MDRTRDHDEDAVRDLWDRLADDWRIQVGDHGDSNRRLNSDPVLWALLGDVAGHRVLDAGCGTGYLSRQLAARGAIVTGIDVSPKMIAIARESSPSLDLRVDSCTALRTVEDGAFDAVVANYVVMDVPDLAGTMAAFHRVLRGGGVAVLVFSHPCFPQARGTMTSPGALTYSWPFPYFEPRACVDPPWKHFTAPFVSFHRPLSTYWKAFRAAAFEVTDFDEPRLTPDRYEEAVSSRDLINCRTRPYSVAFRLRKPDAFQAPTSRSASSGR